ncbi:Uncharacterised protein [Campylobacter sputorum subsp. bubulus]|uniref:Uncharacterized protein n=1 Tax=Campylobacter sputorum subsp. sputorum TaxID=32024 RepID=A0A381DHK0_9BACT|nr:hypothetical protein CSPUT_0923 [Campylobacter sputorum aubsp. sputorum RM3237]ASM36809.1 hypothetical protein CSF_0939 [Campylobacter sputorum bv. faecalis CCUG 20703]SUX08864.1 Uncharacterised protein [Campylobacter sputorum subsp. bubulus]SUX09920.1 Uncharacterised protein [Campylobacter sputorum subsp. sputorum]
MELYSYNHVLEQRYCLGFLLNNHSDEFLVDERHADLWLTDEIRQNINSSNDWFNFFIQYRGKGCEIYQTYIGDIKRLNLGVEVKKREGITLSNIQI